MLFMCHHMKSNFYARISRNGPELYFLEVLPLMTAAIKRFSKGLSLFLVGGAGYILIENIWRGYSHITMFFAGGLSFLCIEIMDVRLGKTVGTFSKCILGSTIITAIEFIFGCIFNLYYKMNVWDYSHLPFNLFGQISLLFSVLWGLLTYPVLGIGKMVRRLLFREPGKKARPAFRTYHFL